MTTTILRLYRRERSAGFPPPEALRRAQFAKLQRLGYVRIGQVWDDDYEPIDETDAKEANELGVYVIIGQYTLDADDCDSVVHGDFEQDPCDCSWLDGDVIGGVVGQAGRDDVEPDVMAETISRWQAARLREVA